MRRTHYDNLGVKPQATASEIRTAYRRLVLVHHPDRSRALDAADKFRALVESYQVLSDPVQRQAYDRTLNVEQERILDRERRAAHAQATAPRPSAAAQARTISSDLARLTALYSRGKFHEAETLAHSVLEVSPREAVAYAILGDIARARGEINHAANMYAHAAQMDGRNPLYQQRFEELLGRSGHAVKATPSSNRHVTAVLSTVGLTLVACVYMALAKERASLPGGFTLGAVVMLFLCGVATGASFTWGGLLDRFASDSVSSSGRVSPTTALASVAVVSFWAAVALYAVMGLTQRTLSYSTTRLITATVGVISLAFLAAQASTVLNPVNVLVWGGNLVYLGGICGWMTTDALRPK